MIFDPSNVLHFGQGFFPPNLVAIRHFQAIWLLLDPEWPLTPAMHYALARGPIKFGGSRTLLSKLTPTWPQLTPHMTFDASNALCSGQGFFPPNLVTIGISKQFDTINDNDMLSYSLTTMMCFLTKEWYGFPAYTVNLFLKAYHKITYKEDLKIT